MNGLPFWYPHLVARAASDKKILRRVQKELVRKTGISETLAAAIVNGHNVRSSQVDQIVCACLAIDTQ